MKTETISHTATAHAILDVIYERRAVRKYKNQPVERNIVEEIIDAGRMAPSAINKQPWKFYVLMDKTTIKSFSKEIAHVALKEFAQPGIKKIVQTANHLLHFAHDFNFDALSDPIFHGAPVVIFITAPRDNEWAQLDIGMCSQNMMLAAKAFGLDSCPVGFGKFVEHAKIFSRLNVPASEQVHISIIIGYGNEKPEMHKRKSDNIIFID
jgi:nitroreductase